MKWADFRGKLLGPTDPASAPAGSLREQIYSKWSDLGLKAQPDSQLALVALSLASKSHLGGEQ